MVARIEFKRAVAVGGKRLRSGTAACLAALTLAAGAAPAETAAEPFWKSEKLRLYVARDGAYHDITAEQMGRIAEAGFNIFGHRWGPGDDAEVRRVADLAGAAGLRYAPWLRGTLSIPEDAPAADADERIVWPSGATQPLYGPLAPALWEHLEERLLHFAELSAEHPQVVGVMLDFENYAPNKQGHLYPVSFDVASLRRFARERGLEAPPDDLAPGDARAWYDARESPGWDEYGEWIARRFRERWTALRERIDAINPRFLVMFYMTPKMTGDVAAEAVATERAPFVALKADYGRPARSFSEAMALAAVEASVERRVRNWRERLGDRVLVTGGALPGYRGDTPVFMARKLAATARLADGYWIWDSGKGNERHWKWMVRANTAVIEGEELSLPEKAGAAGAAEDRAVDRSGEGLRIAMEKDFRGGFRDFVESFSGDAEVRKPTSLDPAYLAGFDAVVLQDYGVPDDFRDEVGRKLREYVRAGGALVLAHRTVLGRAMGSPFPDIVAGPGDPPGGGGNPRVYDRLHRVPEDRRVGALAVFDAFRAHYKPHVPLVPGPEGRVLLENRHGQATLVVGEYGAGRVAITGMHLGRRKAPNETEGAFLRKVFEWLAEVRENREHRRGE